MSAKVRAVLCAAALLLLTACGSSGKADDSRVTLLDGRHITLSGPTLVCALPIDDQGDVGSTAARSQIPSLKSVAQQYPGVRVLITDSDGRSTDDALTNFAANWSVQTRLVVAADSGLAGAPLSRDGQLHTLLIGADGQVAATWTDRAAPTQAIVAALRKATAAPTSDSDSAVRKETP
ncbi:TlpA family protein disulfide reductase [Streptomyces sp. NPDC091280]|uniref:TlpA family protein disulfide reductase n=1 Tax=Streptomyces sp. NPDC091280 TaxID=3365984 RepID=UPI00380F7DFB